MTNEELVAAFQRGTDTERREVISALWDQCERLIKWHANKWGADGFEDRVQDGFLILYKAADDFDARKGVTFSNYLGKQLSWGWIRKADTEGTLAGISIRRMEQIKTYRRTVQEYMQKYACEPPDCAVCDSMGVSLVQLDRIKSAAAAAVIVSLDESRDNDEDGATLLDTIPDEHDFTEDVLEHEQQRVLQSTLWPLVKELEEQQAAVIWERYKKKKTLMEISREHGTTFQRVRQIHDKALRTMGSGRIAERLRPFLYDEERYRLGSRGTSAERFRQTFTSATERAALSMIEKELDRRNG